MSDFTHERTVDSETGRSKLTVTLDGKTCVNIPLTSQIARSYVGFTLIHRDLENALAWVRAAHSLLPPRAKSIDDGSVVITHQETDVTVRGALKAYFYAAIVTYGKCFVSAEGRGTQLQANAYVEPVFNSLHERIMRFRHGLVAHAGDEFDEGEAIVALPQTGNRFHVAANIWRLNLEDDREKTPDFDALIVHVIGKVETRRAILLEKLLDGEGKQLALAKQGKG